jgi:acyl phosphate:glycerol-3-phosphate acyltransferase
LSATYIIVGICSYLLGSIPFGYLLVRAFLKQDIRATGSGNIGATNVGRTGHTGLAITTLLLDAGKGFFAVVGTAIAFAYAMIHAEEWGVALCAFAGLCAIIGHIFPVWLKFKGGKGVATAVGAFAILAPRAVVLALAVFLLTIFITRYVSLSSILATIAFAIAIWFIPVRLTYGARPELLYFISLNLAAALIVVKHHANIRRLLNGTESKFGKKPTSAEIPE